MSSRFSFRPALAALVLAVAIIPAGSAIAAQRDLDLLQSYVGQWQGRGSFGTGDNAESVKCKLTVSRSSPTRVQFNGQCAMAGGAISLYGTLGYIEERNRFEATGSSNVIDKVVAIGRRNGSGIDFNMRPVDDETNEAYDIIVGLGLRDDYIMVKAQVTDVDSGKKLTADVPLEKKS